MPLSVATTCPACGGSLEFPHGSTAVRCGFCGSSHLVTGHGRTLSYVIPERIDLPGAVERALERLKQKGGEWQVREATLFFVPYHHFTGQDLFWCMEEEGVSGGDVGEERGFRAHPLVGHGLESFLGSLEDTPGLGAPRLTEKRFELATRHIDRTLPALDAPGLKVFSLGLRPEVLKLSLFQKEAVLQRGQVSPVQAKGEELERQGYAPARPEGIVARKVIGRTRSIIHFPFWIIEAAARGGQEGVIVVVDGVSGDVTNDAAPPGLLDSLVARDGNHFDTVGMRPLKCPDCGADLPVQPRDVVFFCSECGKAWYIRETELLQVPYTAIPRKGPAAGGEYFPFWVMEARVDSGGEAIGNKYDLSRLAPGLRVPQEADRQIPLRFFVPAFRIDNLNILSRLAGNFTRTQPVWQGEELPRGTAPARGCFISPEDVLELAPLILFSLVPKGNKRALKYALEAKIAVKGAELVLVPFTRSVMDYTDEVVGQSIPIAALRE
jgi:LSD1 subclass zinc finger protein